MGKRQLPSSAEIAASLRQTESASKRRDAISYFGKAIRKADLFQPTWDAVGGAQGLAKTMSEFSLRDLDSMCSCLGQSSGAMGAVTERRAALAELVKTLYDDTYDVRPVHSYYKNIVPACDHQVFEAFEARSGVQWTRSQKKRAFFTHRDELRPKFLADLVSPEGDPVSFKDNMILFHGNVGFCEQVLSATASYGGRVNPDFMDSFALPLLNRLTRRRRTASETRKRVLDLVIDCIEKHTIDLQPCLHFEPKGFISRHLILHYRVSDAWVEPRLLRVLTATSRRDLPQNLFQLAMVPRHKQSGKNRNTGIVYKYDPYPLFRLLLLHLLEFPVDISDDSDAGLERLRKLSSMDHVSWPLEVFTSTEPSLALALLNRLDKVDPTSSFIRVPGSRRTVLQQKGEFDGRHADVEVLRAMLQSRLWAADDPRFQRTREIIEKRKQQAVTAREPLKRAFWAQSALNLCVASGDLDLLEEALVWARRFAKDSQTSRGLFVGHGTGVLTDELDRLVSCVPREDDHPSRLSSDYVVKGIATANRIAIELAQVVAAAASEPAFNIYHWANVLLVTRTMVKLRVDGAAALAKIIGDEALTNETIWKPTITNFFDLDDRHPTSGSTHRELLPSGPRIATLIGQLLNHMTPNHLADLASFSLQTMKTRLSAESLRAMTDATVSITMSLTRSDQPALACPFICQAITNDGGANSSWHRQLFTVEFLSSLPAAAANDFLHSVASAITDIMREQNARPWRPDMKPDPSARHVKVTTIKMVAQALRGNVYLDANSTTNILISLLDEARHIDARITLVSSLIGILEEPTTTPSLRQRVLAALQASVVPVLARVNERFPVADDEWEKVPEVGDESPLLSTLIDRAGSAKLGTEDKAFLTGIITQGLVQSVENNNLWMQAFLAKNKFVVDSLPSSPAHPVILESVLAKFYEFVPVSLLDTMKSIALANLNPPADVAHVTKMVKADSELAASNAGLHWLRVFDDSPRRVLDLGLSEAVAVFLHIDEPACRHISDSDLRSFIIEAAESMVRLGEVDLLDSLVFALSWKRTQGGKHLDVWNNKGVPIIEHIVGIAQALQDASDRPSVLPNTFRLQTKVLPIPFSDTQKSSSAEALDTLARGLSAHIEQLARHRIPYHIDFQHLRDDMSYIQDQDLAYLAVSLAAIDDAVSARDPALEVYLRLELVADFLEKASDPGEEVAGQVRALVGIWKTYKAEGLRVMGEQVEKTLTNKGIGSKHWFTASLDPADKRRASAEAGHAADRRWSPTPIIEYKRFNGAPLGAAGIQVVSRKMDGTKLPELPALGLAPGVKKENIDPEKVVAAWLEKLDKWFQSRQDLAFLFIDDCWWRDILGFDWDFTTKRGVDNIGRYLEGRAITNLQASTGGLKPILLDMGGMVWIQSGFTFKNEHGNGTGFVRLGNVSEGEWRAWIVFTQLEELSRQNEIDAVRNRSHAAAARASHVNGVAHEPQVLIVGAGQAGVSLAARLGSMGVRTLLVDRHGRIGDSWRARYESCTLNTPTFTDHYPFLKYPESWPRWLSRDQVADFMEHYAQLMGLDVRLKTSVTSVKRDEAADRFTVELEGPEGHQTLTPRHVVLATGVFSDEPVMPDIPGMKDFAGQLYHSAKHRTARDVPDVVSKRVVVIGPGTSGHDVAQDFVEHGAKSVTLVQRNPIFSMSAEAWETIQLGLWSMPGLTTEEADVVGNSLPLAVIRTMSIGLTRALAEFDKDMVAGLRAAGLALRTGEDGYGLADHQLIEGGRYYIDQGANDMIIDGRIKVLQCDGGVARLDTGGVELADGRRAEADVVVFATGYRHNITMVGRLMGDDVADAMPRFGLLDDEQERAGWWRPTGVRGFWYMTGSFMYCRQFSQALALQIAAAEAKGS